MRAQHTEASLPTASALELVLKCAASAALPAVYTAYEAADEGTDLHATTQRVARTGEAPSDERTAAIVEKLPAWAAEAGTEAAFAYDVRADTGRYLGANLHHVYNQTPQEFAGAADWSRHSDGLVRVLDLKTGRTETPRARRNWQVRTLGLAFARAANADGAEVSILHAPPEGTPWLDVAVLDAFALEEVADGLRTAASRIRAERDAVRKGETPRLTVGEHCRHCKARFSCPAWAGATDRALGLKDATPAQRYEALKQLEAVVRDVKRRVYEDARAERIDLGGGRYFGVHATTERELAGAVVYDVVRELHGEEAARIATSFDASFAAIERAVRPYAVKRGDLSALKERVTAAVTARGGLKTRETREIGEYEEGT